MKNKIFIVGGGHSLTPNDFCLLNKVTTIAVNKSFFFLKNPDCFVTMDYSFLRKLATSELELLQKSNCSKFFVLNSKFVKQINGVFVDTKNSLPYKQLNIFDVIVKSKKEEGIGFSWADFRHGDNSGYCALQLAVLLGYKEIYLCGIDLNIAGNKTHFHSGYGEDKKQFELKLERYFDNFLLGITECLKNGIKLTSCSPVSRLNKVIEYKPLSFVIGS